MKEIAKGCSYRTHNGLTLIEVLFVITSMMSLAYVAFLSMRPALNLAQIELSLSRYQHLTMALQAYHRVYDHWPDGADLDANCQQGLAVLSDASQGAAFIQGVSHNSFGQPYELTCSPGNILSPLYLSQLVPFKYLSYFRRYQYRVAVDLQDTSTNTLGPDSLVRVTTPIPVSQSQRQKAVVQVPFINSQALIPTAAGVQDIALASLNLEGHQAFVPMPAQCLNYSRYTLHFTASALCASPRPADLTQTQRFEFPIRVGPIENTPQLTGTFDIVRMVQWGGYSFASQPCALQVDAIECDSTGNATAGWRVSANAQSLLSYRVDYRLPFGDRRVIHTLTLAAEQLPELQRDLVSLLGQDFLHSIYLDPMRSVLYQNNIQADISALSFGEVTQTLQPFAVSTLSVSDCRGLPNQHTVFGTQQRPVSVGFQNRLAAFVQCFR